jgi:hypothetical protein
MYVNKIFLVLFENKIKKKKYLKYINFAVNPEVIKPYKENRVISSN